MSRMNQKAHAMNHKVKWFSGTTREIFEGSGSFGERYDPAISRKDDMETLRHFLSQTIA